MIDFEMLVDEIRIKARAAILDGCNLDLEPSQFSDCMEYLIDRLRQAEKDAARYRWLRQQPCSGWEVDGDETSHIGVTMWRNDGFDNCNSGESLSGGQMDAAIDEAMQCNK